MIHNTKISIIAAIGKNRELGKNNKLLWHIPEDFKRFKTLTSGHPIIMGRKTWESLPIKPLPNRYNIVITRDLGFKINDLGDGEQFAIASSMKEALEESIKYYVSSSKYNQEDKIHDTKYMIHATEHEVFIIGGGQIYRQALEKGLVDKLYLTIVDANFDADTFFPDYSQFKKVIFEKTSQSEKYRYKFLDLER